MKIVIKSFLLIYLSFLSFIVSTSKIEKIESINSFTSSKSKAQSSELVVSNSIISSLGDNSHHDDGIQPRVSKVKIMSEEDRHKDECSNYRFTHIISPLKDYDKDIDIDEFCINCADIHWKAIQQHCYFIYLVDTYEKKKVTIPFKDYMNDYDAREKMVAKIVKYYIPGKINDLEKIISSSEKGSALNINDQKGTLAFLANSFKKLVLSDMYNQCYATAWDPRVNSSELCNNVFDDLYPSFKDEYQKKGYKRPAKPTVKVGTKPVDGYTDTLYKPGTKEEKFGGLSTPYFKIIDALRSEHKDAVHQFFDEGIEREHEDFTTAFSFTHIKNKLNEFEKENKIEAEDLVIYALKKYTRPFHGFFHEFLMVCAADPKNEHEYYFVIDRGGVVSTKIRYIYTNKASIPKDSTEDKICQLDSKYWVEGVRSGNTKEGSEGVKAQDHNKRKIKMSTFIIATVKYVRDFPNYEMAGSNCQHFATGFFNAMTTGIETEKTDKSPIGVQSIYSKKQLECDFGIYLEKTGKRKKFLKLKK